MNFCLIYCKFFDVLQLGQACPQLNLRKTFNLLIDINTPKQIFLIQFKIL